MVSNVPGVILTSSQEHEGYSLFGFAIANKFDNKTLEMKEHFLKVEQIKSQLHDILV